MAIRPQLSVRNDRVRVLTETPCRFYVGTLDGGRLGGGFLRIRGAEIRGGRNRKEGLHVVRWGFGLVVALGWELMQELGGVWDCGVQCIDERIEHS